ncbi:hypothetical protein MDAP_002884 [Mitosporidium daphniae]
MLSEGYFTIHHGHRSAQKVSGQSSFETIPDELLSEACERLEILAREKASNHKVSVCFSKDFDMNSYDPSSRFLSKINSISELSSSQSCEDLDKFVSITLSGSSAASIESCQNEIIQEAILNVGEKSPLLSYRRLPLLQVGDFSSEQNQQVRVSKTHLTLFSPASLNHLHSRQLYAKMLKGKGYKAFVSELPVDGLVQLLVHSGPYHLALQSFLFENSDVHILLPCSLILSSNADQLIVLEKEDRADKVAKKASADFLKASKKVSIASKKLVFDTVDLFFILNSAVSKAKLVDLLFRHGCVLRIFEAPTNPSKKHCLTICLYGGSMDIIEEVSREIFTLICQSSSHFEASGTNYSISVKNAGGFCSVLDSENINDPILIQFSGVPSQAFHAGEPNLLTINSLVCKGTKDCLLKTLSNIEPLFCQSSIFSADIFNSSYQDRHSLLSKSLSYLSLANLSIDTCFTYRIGTLSLDCEFISGKKDGKLSKISRGTGCQVLMDVPQGWRTDIKITSQSLPLLVKAVEMLEGELPASLSFFVPDHHHKRIIGHGGKHIQKWMKLFGVYVKFSNNNTGNSNPIILTHPNDGKKGAGGAGSDIFFQNIRPNVLIRTPAKNIHALAQMKSAILDLAGEEDQTLGVFASHSHKTAEASNSFFIPSLVPEVSITGNTASSLHFYVALLKQIETTSDFDANQRSIKTANVDVPKPEICQYPHDFYLQECVEQELEASIELLFEDGGLDSISSFKLSKSSLLAMENLGAKNANSSVNDTRFNLKDFSMTINATPAPAPTPFQSPSSSKFPAISRPASTTVPNTIFPYPFSIANRKGEDYFHWDSLLGFGRASMSLGGTVSPISSTRISSSPIRPV